MSTDRMRTIDSVEPRDGGLLALRWSDGTEADVMLEPEVLKALGGLAQLGSATLGNWGHFIAWPTSIEIGLARRTVAYYSNGERRIPKAILLACAGWEAGKGIARAA